MTYSPPDRPVLNRRGVPMAMASLMFLLLQAAAQAQPLQLAYTTQFTLAYKDTGGGGDYDGSFWEPKVPAGYKPLGQIASGDPNYRAPAGMAIVSLAGVGSALAYPVDFESIWWDKGSGAEMYGLMWKPIPPPNYVSLGTVCSINNWDKPALTSVVCVRKDLTVEGTVGDWIYDDSGTGSDQDGSAWKIVAPPGAIDLHTFIGQRSHSKPAVKVYCLKASAVAPPAAPSPSTLESVLSTFGPIFQFHPQEAYLPDDPEVVLNDPATRLRWMTVQNENSNPGFAQNNLGAKPTSATTLLDDVQEALSHPLAGASSFRYLLDYPDRLLPGNRDRAKSYVRVQPHGYTTELQFWLFYPYNGPGKSRLTVGDVFKGSFDPTGTMGLHYSDWESVRVRVTNKDVWNPGVSKLVSVVLSRHSSDEEVFAGDPRLAIVAGHPVVYVARDSHAQYPTRGTHFYARPKVVNLGVGTFAVDLYDLTGGGQTLNSFHPSKRVLVSSAWPGIAPTAPDWLFFGGSWGRYLSNSFTVNVKNSTTGLHIYSHTETEIGNGKPGLIRRSEWAVPNSQDANLGSLRVNAGALSPPFSPSVQSYTLTGADGVDQITLTPQASDHEARVEVSLNGEAFTLMGSQALLGRQSNPLTLRAATNYFQIKVTAQGGSVFKSYYVVAVKRAAGGTEWVTTTNDSGPGSLRQVIANLPADATAKFDAGLSGQTITLVGSGLTIGKNLTIDASGLQ